MVFFQFVQIFTLINYFISKSCVMQVVDTRSHCDCTHTISTPACVASCLSLAFSLGYTISDSSAEVFVLLLSFF